MLNAYLYDGARTAFGRHAGALSGLRPDDLAAHVLRSLAQRSPMARVAEDVVLGCTCQAGEDSRNIARHAALLAGLGAQTPGQTVNRLCGSGLAALVDGARAISVGEGDVYLVGGVESMSRAPFVMAKAESPYSRDLRVADSTIGARFPNPQLVQDFGNHSMPETADAVAAELGLTREACDAYALQSQQRFAAAQAAGVFAQEIVPIDVPQGRKAAPLVFAVDEHPRADTTLASLQKLRPLFDGGVTTAGNASGINDGAAAVLLGSLAAGERHGQQPLARVLSAAVAGVEPRLMGLGPVTAIERALRRAGLALSQVDLIEINEAFAAQVLGCLQRLGLSATDARVNPNGGAIAVGHPLGASGARLALSAAHELRRRNGRYAVVSLCIGVGQGIAVVLERA
ncbi:3-oxoadipyl-CoA thiolase [uncultured Rhodoferax sp.]|uniref:3-oxoadipyl-CoA thiolase n=1 Tax=uncultured Rhodoferax sp. TaxID=223188 RepID=UPI0025D3CB20|nr:3-oxoadipyl-CoA thiolase [uncultured Rhodoferax sp.]